MKQFLDKNPMIHFTSVLTLIAIICGILIGGINAWTSPIITANEEAATLVAYQEVLPQMVSYEALSVDQDANSILSKVVAYDAPKDDANKNIIGYIYKGYDTNGYGSMTIVVAVDTQGIIVGAKFLSLNQTLNLDTTRHNLSLYVGTDISDLSPNGDIVSGATYSKNTMVSILSDIADSFATINVSIDPFTTSKGAVSV